METHKERLLRTRKESLISWIDCLDINLDDTDNEAIFNEIEYKTKQLKEILLQTI